LHYGNGLTLTALDHTLLSNKAAVRSGLREAIQNWLRKVQPKQPKQTTLPTWWTVWHCMA